MRFKKTALIGLNASFSHTSLAIYSLARMKPNTEQVIREFTINENPNDIFRALVELEADLYGFSCYLWNIDLILKITEWLKTVRPDSTILLGGPEVSFDAKRWMEDAPHIDMIQTGEGECSWVRFFEADASEVPGLWYREGGRTMAPSIDNPAASLEDLPAVYDDFPFLENRLYYYEASRGCPYRCAFCLSSVDTLRAVPMETVKKELLSLLQARVRTVKFVDRTMNADSSRFLKMIDFIEKHDNGFTGFHMEIHPAALLPQEIERLRTVRKGLLQFEIGIQSTNPETCKAVHRVGDSERIFEVVQALREPDHIHLHLDLIAGLPYEGLAEFQKSFEEVMKMRPHKLQLGFLKLLRGTELRLRAEEYGIQYQRQAPYEVLMTPWLTASELFLLQDIAHLVDALYNEGWLQTTLSYLIKMHESSTWALFCGMAKWAQKNSWHSHARPKDSWYEFCYQYGLSIGCDPEFILDTLRYDALLRSPRLPKTTILEFTPWRTADFLSATVQKILNGISDASDKSLYQRTRADYFSFDMEKFREYDILIRNKTRMLFLYEEETSVHPIQ